jgi:hypothetical protein
MKDVVMQGAAAIDTGSAPTFMEAVRNLMRRRPSMVISGEARADAMFGERDLSPSDAFRKQKGVGALEYIAIGFVILALLWGILSRAGMLNFTINNLAENAALAQLWQSIHTNLKSTSGYGASGTSLVQALSQTNGIPSNLTYDSASFTLYNTYGQAYTITSTGMGFQIVDPGVSQADCIKILVQQSGGGNWGGGIGVGGTTVTSAISTTQGATMCTGTTNSITLIASV